MTTRRHPYHAALVRQPTPDVDPEAEVTEERQRQPRGEEAGGLPPSAFDPAQLGATLGVDPTEFAEVQAALIAEALRDLLEDYRNPPLLYAVPLATDARHPTVTRLAGYALRETAGVAAGVVELRNGSAAGALLWTVVVPADESRERIFPRPIDASAGIFAVVTGGTVAGALVAG